MAATPPVCDFGWTAPGFSLPATDGQTYALADIRGDIDVLAESAAALRMSLGLARAAAEEYVQSTAAPVEARPAQQGTPAAPNQGK